MGSKVHGVEEFAARTKCARRVGSSWRVRSSPSRGQARGATRAAHGKVRGAHEGSRRVAKVRGKVRGVQKTLAAHKKLAARGKVRGARESSRRARTFVGQEGSQCAAKFTVRRRVRGAHKSVRGAGKFVVCSEFTARQPWGKFVALPVRRTGKFAACGTVRGARQRCAAKFAACRNVRDVRERLRRNTKVGDTRESSQRTGKFAARTNVRVAWKRSRAQETSRHGEGSWRSWWR